MQNRSLGGSDRASVGGRWAARSLQPNGTRYNSDRRLPNNIPMLRYPTIRFVAGVASQKPDIRQWFAAACRTILGKDAGGQLYWLTRHTERSCYRYAAGETTPSSEFLRKLFCSDFGEPFLLSFMASCSARWWRDWQSCVGGRGGVSRQDEDHDVMAIIDQLQSYGVPPPVASELISDVLKIGAATAVYRKETADQVADVMARRWRASSLQRSSCPVSTASHT